MCLLCSTNWVFISQKTTFFIVTAVKTSNLTTVESVRSCSCNIGRRGQRFRGPRGRLAAARQRLVKTFLYMLQLTVIFGVYNSMTAIQICSYECKYPVSPITNLHPFRSHTGLCDDISDER
jgi:hypothetical protein